MVSQKNQIKIIIGLFLALLILNIFTPTILAQNTEKKTCLIYFTSLNCPNCAVTDPQILGEWPKKYNNIIIIEYVFSNWGDENAQLLGLYSDKYESMSAVPNLFLNENENYIGRIEVLDAENKIKNLKQNPCLLFDKSTSFEDLDLNVLENAKIWVGNRVLEKTGNEEVSNKFLKELLFSENLEETIKNSDYNLQTITPKPMPISKGKIEFQNAINIEDSWILEFNDKVNLNEINENNNQNNKENNSSVKIPIFGKLNIKTGSLFLITLLIGLADGFNPCAFFILSFLLATMLYAAGEGDKTDRGEEIKEEPNKKRKKILLVGGIFVFFSALIYFLFMSLWLNIFLYAKQIIFLTAIAGIIAVFAGLVNIKDYFFFKKGISFTLPITEKIKFTRKVEKLKNVKTLPALIIGTIIIAVTVNMYELLCTVGFPMVYLGALAARELSSFSYYFHIFLYNLFYIIPIATIVLIFAITLGSKKFSVEGVKKLKLISGFMILFLGLVLLFKPELLENFIVSLGLLVSAVIISLIIMFFRRVV